MPMDVQANYQSEWCLSPVAYKYAKTRQELLDEAQESLKKANWHMKKYADKGNRPLEYEVGDKVIFKLTP